MDRTLIDRYAGGADQLARGIAGLSSDELNSYPIPGTWSVQQIVVHMMDSDLIGSDRMKRVIAEDRPLLIGYNETRFAERLRYDHVDPFIACDIFAKNRYLVSHLLRELPDETFERWGVHSEHGRVSLGQLVASYVDHLDHHMRFLHAKRRALGKPLEPTAR